MATFNLFIGSNNKTKRLEVDKIERIMNKRHKGYTVEYCFGYWQGKKEKSAKVLVTDDGDLIMQSVKELKRELQQDSIAYQEAPELSFA